MSCRGVMGFFSPIQKLLDDPSISELLINGPFEIWIERDGNLKQTDFKFEDRPALEAALTAAAQRTGCVFDYYRPVLETHLPNGSRIEAVRSSIAERGPVVAIRKISHNRLTLSALVKLGSLTRDAADYLMQAIDSRKSVIVSGGTGSGKTSMLGALADLSLSSERIVVLEDTREIHLKLPHVVYLQTRGPDTRGMGAVSLRDLFRATLRLRPDRIVIGEVRGSETVDLIQAMTSGHKGSLTTAHASSPLDLMRRLETMAMMNDCGIPLAAMRGQVASAVDVIVQVERLSSGQRVVSEIALSNDSTSSGEYCVRPVFVREKDCLIQMATDTKRREGSE